MGELLTSIITEAGKVGEVGKSVVVIVVAACSATFMVARWSFKTILEHRDAEIQRLKTERDTKVPTKAEIDDAIDARFKSLILDHAPEAAAPITEPEVQPHPYLSDKALLELRTIVESTFEIIAREDTSDPFDMMLSKPRLISEAIGRLEQSTHPVWLGNDVLREARRDFVSICRAVTRNARDIDNRDYSVGYFFKTDEEKTASIHKLASAAALLNAGLSGAKVTKTSSGAPEPQRFDRTMSQPEAVAAQMELRESIARTVEIIEDGRHDYESVAEILKCVTDLRGSRLAIWTGNEPLRGARRDFIVICEKARSTQIDTAMEVSPFGVFFRSEEEKVAQVVALKVAAAKLEAGLSGRTIDG